MLQPKLSLYVITVVLLMLVLPVVSILIAHFGFGSAIGWMLIGRWFVFCALGMRLFTAGIRQVIKPELTAKEIFHFTGEESYAVVRELGLRIDSHSLHLTKETTPAAHQRKQR
jgi:hypothetical protein